MLTKSAILIVSFGTTYPDTRKKSIGSVEQAFQRTFPDSKVFRAFTSNVVIKRIQKNEQIKIDTPTEALEKIRQAGFEQVYVQSLHLIPGIEYDLVKEVVVKFQSAFQKIVLGAPLLKTFEDYQRLVAFIKGMVPTKAEHSGLLLMGHGTADSAFTAYACLDHMLMGTGNYVGAVESYPDIDFEIQRLTNDGIQHVVMQPLMMVAGNHAHHDMASDSPTSWSSQLQVHGITADAKFIGLGEYPEIQQMYIDHLKQVM